MEGEPAMNLEKMLEAIERSPRTPVPLDPFNGATEVLLSPGTFDRVAPYLTAEIAMFPPRTFAVDSRLPDGTGIGFRPWREGDDELDRTLGKVVCFVLSKPAPSAES